MRARLTLLLILFLLSSCTFGGPSAAETTGTPVPTATPVPTVGPTSTPPAPLVILVLPADMNEDDSRAYQKAVYTLSQEQGYRFIVLNQLKQSDLEPSLKIVIDLSAEEDIAAMAKAAPQAQFITVNNPTVQPGGNLSILGGQAASMDKVAFMAGYIGAITTLDYRTGALLRKGSPEADIIITAMRAGQEYFCGLCNSMVPPIEEYPLFQDVPEDAKPSEYGAYADILIRRQVTTIFIQPGLESPELLQYLQGAGIMMIGTQTPKETVDGWVVSLQSNYLEALQAAFPELAAGNGGKSFPAPLSFNDANSSLFGEGKQRNARGVLNDLINDLISTNVK